MRTRIRRDYLDWPGVRSGKFDIVAPALLLAVGMPEDLVRDAARGYQRDRPFDFSRYWSGSVINAAQARRVTVDLMLSDGSSAPTTFTAPDAGFRILRSSTGPFHAIPQGGTLTLCSDGAMRSNGSPGGGTIDSSDWLGGSIAGSEVTCEWCLQRLVAAGLTAAQQESPLQAETASGLGAAPTASEPEQESPAIQELGAVTEVSSPLSGDYRPADERPQGISRDPFSFDPEELDRKTLEHQRLQNKIWSLANAAGFAVHSPAQGDPVDFDLAWTSTEGQVVVEVKTLSSKNESKQLRLGVGQVLDYQDRLQAAGAEVKAVLAVDRKPTQPHWEALCRRHGVTLVWPETLDSLFS